MSDFVCCSGINIGAIQQKVSKNERIVKNRVLTIDVGYADIVSLAGDSFSIGTVFQNCVILISKPSSDYSINNPYVMSLPYTFNKCTLMPIIDPSQIYLQIKNATFEDCECLAFDELSFKHKGKMVQIYGTGDGFYFAPIDWDEGSFWLLPSVKEDDTKEVVNSLINEFIKSYLPSKKIDVTDIELASSYFSRIFSSVDSLFSFPLVTGKTAVFNTSFFIKCYFRFSEDFVKSFLKNRSIKDGQGSESWIPGHGNWATGILFKHGVCSGCYYSAIQDYWSDSTVNFYMDIVEYGGDVSPIMVFENLGDFASFAENWDGGWSPISICFKPNCWVDCPDVDPEYFTEVLTKIMDISAPKELKVSSTSHETCFYLTSTEGFVF